MKTNAGALRAAARVEGAGQALYGDLAGFLVYEPNVNRFFASLALEDAAHRELLQRARSRMGA